MNMNTNGIPTRKTLIQRIKDVEDDVSWEEFYNYYRDYLYVVIINMGISHYDAEELLQEILVKAWKAIPDFDYSPEKGKFRWWLCRITKNAVYTFLKKSSRQPSKEDLDDTVSTTKHLRTEPEIDNIIEKEWQRFIANKAWNNISSEFSDKFLQAFLKLAEGSSIKDVAASSGIEEGTLYVYKARIQKKLCREIAKLNYELNC